MATYKSKRFVRFNWTPTLPDFSIKPFLLPASVSDSLLFSGKEPGTTATPGSLLFADKSLGPWLPQALSCFQTRACDHGYPRLSPVFRQEPGTMAIPGSLLFSDKSLGPWLPQALSWDHGYPRLSPGTMATRLGPWLPQLLTVLDCCVP